MPAAAMLPLAPFHAASANVHRRYGEHVRRAGMVWAGAAARRACSRLQALANRDVVGRLPDRADPDRLPDAASGRHLTAQPNPRRGTRITTRPCSSHITFRMGEWADER